jgi:aspartyl-tRNA(Asn)/glutamyl-tRNA(Gln) amidotransferase subunit B
MSYASKYEAVIGLEVHAQLSTKTKLFCGCSTAFGSEPNSNVCPICLGHPGVLPVLNKKVVEFAVIMGIAANCKINNKSVFARKNYFYPDLPKGYQISQFEKPICENGFIEISSKDGIKKRIRITRIHIEEDAGKSIHDQGEYTLIDTNRCGVPLIEIVSEPDISSGEEASLYMQKIKQLLKYLNICDGNMEEGSLRCDANISVRLAGNEKLGTKTEVKNLNSFRFVEKAIKTEIERQIEILEDGGIIKQQTLLWNSDFGAVLPMRSKEESHDYRYFPDPDLLPIEVNDEWKLMLANSLIELPDAKKERLINIFNLPEYDADILTETRDIADFFERVATVCDDYKSISNWIMGDLFKELNEKKIKISDFIISPENLGELLNLIKKGIISTKIAKEIFVEMLNENKPAAEIVKEKKLSQLSDIGEIKIIVDKVLSNNEQQLKEYLNGKDKVFGFFVGQVMKITNGRANPNVVRDILQAEIEKRRTL